MDTRQSPGGFRNIRRGDPSILMTRQSATMNKLDTAGVNWIEVESPGSFTEGMVAPGWKKRKGGERGNWGRMGER